MNGDTLLACGVDIIELASWRRNLAVGGQRFLDLNFTEHELAWCGGEPQRLAARFAAKEAVAKALGTGFRDDVQPSEIEVMTLDHGQPTLHLHGAAAARADALELRSWSVSLSHGDMAVIAFVVGLTRKLGSHFAPASLALPLPGDFDFESIASLHLSRLVGVKD